jgi:hypothetical protein
MELKMMMFQCHKEQKMIQEIFQYKNRITNLQKRIHNNKMHLINNYSIFTHLLKLSAPLTMIGESKLELLKSMKRDSGRIADQMGIS